MPKVEVEEYMGSKQGKLRPKKLFHLSFETADDLLRAAKKFKSCAINAYVANLDPSAPDSRVVLRPKVFIDDATLDALFSISEEELQALPLWSYDGKVIVVERSDQVKKAVDEILGYRDIASFEAGSIVLGMDVEWKPARVSGEVNNIALLQLTNGSTTILVRLCSLAIEARRRSTNASNFVFELPKVIKDLLESSNIEKVGAGLDSDIDALQSEFPGLRAQGVKDSQKIPIYKRCRPRRLDALVAIFLKRRIDKSMQRSNWEAKTLSPAQVAYAATDAWASLMVHKELSLIPYEDI